MSPCICTICAKPMKEGQELVCPLGKRAWATVISDGDILHGYHRQCFDEVHEKRDFFDHYKDIA